MNKNLIKALGGYIKSSWGTAAFFLGISIIYAAVFMLYGLPLESVGYATILALALAIVVFIFRFTSYYKKHKMLLFIKNNITLGNNLPHASGDVEEDYQSIFRLMDEEMRREISKRDKGLSEMKDYYAMWAHQIKTPIAAMNLMLQNGNIDKNSLSEQLFRIEQYVDMVLQYLRSEDMSKDIQIRRCSLDRVVKSSVKKFAKLFIRKHISLNYEELGVNVLTDDKWLSFVIDQILSNALKYTNNGSISIYMDKGAEKTLVIEDTGIGIEEEDLPRIFENGFTGYNGREDKKSTGIGLYLCKRVMTRLSHRISLESVQGQGTKVKLDLSVKEMERE